MRFRPRASLRSTTLATLAVAHAACSGDAATVAPPPASASPSAPAAAASAVAPPGSDAPPATSASTASSSAWPRGLVCGVQAGDVNAFGDAVTSRSISLTESSLTLSERSAKSSRTTDELVATGFTPGATKVPTFTRTDGDRQLRIVVGRSGALKLDTTCKGPDGGITTADAERAGWIPADVHRRIGRGRVSSFQASDGDEHYVRAHFTTVEARPDTTGLVDEGHGAFRNAAGAEPACLIVLRDDPLIVEMRSGSAFLVDNALAMHRSTHAR